MWMTPDKTVQWQTSEIPSRQGLLLRPPGNEARDETATVTVLRFASMSEQELAQQDKIGSGRWATVFKVGDMAIKVFNAEELWDYPSANSINHLIGHNAIRANIIMAEGLKRARVKNLGVEWGGSQLLHSAPGMSACFISEIESPQPGGGNSTRAVWAMTYEHGTLGSGYDDVLPDVKVLTSYYDHAIALCEAKPGDIDYDDNRTRSNEIVRVEGGRLSEIVKLDVTANIMHSWRSLDE